MVERNTGTCQKCDVDPFQIYFEFSVFQTENVRFYESAQGIDHSVGHIGVGLKAALGNSRADGGQNIFRSAAVVLLHLADGFSGNVLCSSPPPGMDGSYDPFDRVVQ